MTLRPRHAFTLIEVLVVMGLVAMFVGILGVAWRGDSPSLALESAQQTVASLLAAARGEAVLRQNRATLVVTADPGDECFLRRISIVVETAPGSGHWRMTGEGMLLPRGVYLVPGPGSVNLNGATMGSSDGAVGTWPVTRRSSLELAPMGLIEPEADSATGQYLYLVTPLGATGMTGGEGKLVLAPARRTLAGLVFEHPEQVRGVSLSSYGVGTLINDAAGFDN